MVLPCEGGRATLSVTDDGQWRGDDVPSMRVFIPKRWSILYGPMTFVAGVYPDPAKEDALDCFEGGSDIVGADLAKSLTSRFACGRLSTGKKRIFGE
jgi:hypothetical protein